MTGLRLDERILTKSEFTTASLVAKRAFFNDAYFRFLSPGDRPRDKGLTIFFRANLGYYRRFGYELLQTLRPVEEGPPLFTMWR
jgi:hypothetical protein